LESEASAILPPPSIGAAPSPEPTMPHPEAVESLEHYASVWKALVDDRPGADTTDGPGLSLSWADSPFPFWNAVFLTEQIADAEVLQTRIDDAARYVRRKTKAGLIYICEEYLSGTARGNLTAAVARAGLDFALPITGMAGDILPLQAPPHPRLKIRRVTDAAALQAYADINSEGYGFPLESGRAGLKGQRLWTSEAFSFLGYEDGHPVSAASAVPHKGRLYLALVATRPAAQRKGYGEAVVRHALQAAHQATGLTRTILHATDAGAPVYARVGYRRTARFLTYKPAG
jgi:GNAT superfamily N-acetyltransferase